MLLLLLLCRSCVPLCRSLQKAQKVQGVPRAQEVHGHQRIQRILVYQALPTHRGGVFRFQKLLRRNNRLIFSILCLFTD